MVKASSPSTRMPVSSWRHPCRRCLRSCSVRTSSRHRRTWGPTDYTKFQIHQANSLLAETLLTENVIIPGTGHNIMLYAPQVVADKIIVIVDRIRSAP